MQTPVAIVGSGPAGATTAICLAKEGIESVIIEREQFPRFHIGESLTGESGGFLRRFGFEEEMTARSYPVKHGVHVFGTGGKNTFFVPVVRVDPDGSRVPTTTWQVRRSSFDAMLLDRAREVGTEIVSAKAERPVVDDDGRVVGIEIEHADGRADRVDCDMLVDATGQQCFLSRAGITGPKDRGRYDAQIAIFTHLEGASRGVDPDQIDNTIIFYEKPNHWAWMIPIDDDVVSIGVVVPASYYRARGESMNDFLTRELAELNPALAERTAGATFAMEPQAISNYSFRIREFAGPGWMCVGDSHRFTDPVFSFGVHLALHEAEEASKSIAKWLGDQADLTPLSDYVAFCERGQDIIADLIDAFWTEPLAFGFVAHRKHPDDIMDLFAGRIYHMPGPSDGLMALRRIKSSATAA